MNAILFLNLSVLGGTLILLIVEEIRYRGAKKRVEDTKQDLTAIVQQLRSPLSSVRKFNEFLRSKEFGALSFAQQEAVGRAEVAVSESLVLLDRLLLRSRLDEGTAGFHASSRSIQEALRGAVNAVRPLSLGKKQTLTLRGKTRAQIHADPLVLHGIFDEILFNAVRYTPEKGSITAGIEEKGKTVCISITDTGIGIPASEQPMIFRKFFRGQKARALCTGTGLGLPFAKEFAERLGGTITFRSSESKGSTFVVTFPVR